MRNVGLRPYVSEDGLSPTGNLTRRWLGSLLQILLMFELLSGCSLLESVTKPAAMDTFYRANGWTPLPIPDSKLAPGALIEITDNKVVRYWDDLSTCGVPTDLLKPVSGKSPQLTFNQDADYKAEAVLQVSGVTAGPDFSKVHTTRLTHQDHGADALKLIAIQIWLADPQNSDKFPQACKEFFNGKNHFLVQESYRVAKGKYALIDKNEATIKVTNLALGPLKIEPGASAKVTSDGELLFDQIVYTAIRNVRRLDGQFQTLGKLSPTQSDDALIDELLHMK